MTKHSDTCHAAFGRKDMTCPRCLELANGAAPIVWRGSRNRILDAQRSKAIREHDFAACMRRNSVCTCFDY